MFLSLIIYYNFNHLNRNTKKIKTAAMRASYLASLSIGYWKKIEELKTIAQLDKVFEPKLEQEEREKLIKG